MNRAEVMKRIEDSGIIAVIRLSAVDKLEKIIETLIASGIEALEITMTTPGAIEIIRRLSGRFSDNFILGVGTVLNPDIAEQAIQAGAEFVVSPVLYTAIIKRAKQYDKVCICGAFSPTEIYRAWEAGADVVKIFPAAVLGHRYFKNIHGPLPEIKLSPTGGVNLENAADFIRSGAVCLGIGSALLNKKMIAEGDWKGLTAHARAFKNTEDSARAQQSNRLENQTG